MQLLVYKLGTVVNFGDVHTGTYIDIIRQRVLLVSDSCRAQLSNFCSTVLVHVIRLCGQQLCTSSTTFARHEPNCVCTVVELARVTRNACSLMTQLARQCELRSDITALCNLRVDGTQVVTRISI